jgi:hypothetical protein
MSTYDVLSDAEVEKLILSVGAGQPQGFTENDIKIVCDWAWQARLDNALLDLVLSKHLVLSVVDGEIEYRTPDMIQAKQIAKE